MSHSKEADVHERRAENLIDAHQLSAAQVQATLAVSKRLADIGAELQRVILWELNT